MRLIRGVFGGTFDPVHEGHVRLGRELMQSGHYDCIQYVVNAQPPHREQPKASAHHRLAMLEIALAREPGLIADDREIARAGVSYTFDTLLEIRAELGAHQPLALILGSDAFMTLPGWHRWRDLASLAHFVVLTRADLDAQMQDVIRDLSLPVLDGGALKDTPAGALWFANQPVIPLCATDIRQRLGQREQVDNQLTSEVLDYIRSHSLY